VNWWSYAIIIGTVQFFETQCRCGLKTANKNHYHYHYYYTCIDNMHKFSNDTEPEAHRTNCSTANVTALKAHIWLWTSALYHVSRKKNPSYFFATSWVLVFEFSWFLTEIFLDCALIKDHSSCCRETIEQTMCYWLWWSLIDRLLMHQWMNKLTERL